MIGIPLGIVYANAFEWVIHKHLLHGLGRNKKSFWAFHWHEHHKKARKHDMHDDQYAGRNVFVAILKGDQTAKTKEAVGLIAASALHLPLLPIAPFFTVTVWACAANYYRVHRRSHLDPVWAEEHVPWHVDHHMGKNQDANWCVTWPLTDWIMGTREKYVGTPAWLEAKARAAREASKVHGQPSSSSSSSAASEMEASTPSEPPSSASSSALAA